jgi:chromosome segregation ATPase
VPGHEFPQLPERVARALQLLWNQALEGAHETLQGTLIESEHALTQREQALETATQQLAEREQAAMARLQALEESLALAREQLTAANQRAEALEESLHERGGECARLRGQIERLETSAAETRAKFDAASAAHHAERVQLQGRHTEAERHWLLEVDRSRQLAKEATKDQERQVKELRAQVTALHSERDHLREQLVDARSELKTASAVREQLDERLRSIPSPEPRRARTRSTRKLPRSAKSTIR